MKTYAFAGLAAGLLSLAAVATVSADNPTGAVVGQAAPAFSLQDTAGTTHTLEQYTKEGKVVVLEWFNADCPFVKKHHKDHKTMKETAARYHDRNVVWLAINSSAEGKQGAGVERNVKAKEEYGIEYPILMDTNGAIGRAYGAKCTPHMFVIDGKGKVAYNGAIDDNKSPDTVGTNFVAAALDAVLEGKPAANASNTPYGCGVKYSN